MDEPVVATPCRMLAAFARLSSDAVDTLCSAIASFALLAGARAFMFTALLGWREPVLGGAGLVVLALVGWLRWRCGAPACAVALSAQECRQAGRVGRACGSMVEPPATLEPGHTKARNDACYNRLKQCGSRGST